MKKIFFTALVLIVLAGCTVARPPDMAGIVDVEMIQIGEGETSFRIVRNCSGIT